MRPPPPRLLPVILKLKDSYGVWQGYLNHFPKSHRFTLGSKIDSLFLDSIESSFFASYSMGETKLNHVENTISKIDLLKLLLQLAWEMQAIDNNKYIHISELLAEVGKMLGGWKRQLVNKTPAK
jgi:hypothetical protein